MNKIYALYKGDKFIFVGTKEEIANILHVQPRTIIFYASQSYRNRFIGREDNNRIIVIKVDQDEEIL